MSGGRVSVIIPAYRAATTICRAVDSVLAQTRAVHEIIVVDDGSPDETAAVVEREYGSRVVLVRQANGKTAAARNAGIERATGDFIAFLDADDYWEPRKLEQQLGAFERHPEVGLVAGRYFEEPVGKERFESPEDLLPASAWDRVLSPDGAEAFRIATVVWTGTVMMRRAALGGERFVSGLEPAEDRDLWARIVAKWPVYLLFEPLATAVLEAGSISRSGIERDCRNMLRVVERHAGLLGKREARVWRSHTLYRWAANEPRPGASLWRLAQSFWVWPLPYGKVPGMPRFGRVKRMLVMLARAARLRSA